MRSYSNVAPPVSLTVAATNVATTLTVASTTGYPAAPFLLGLERGTANEEVVLCTALTATTFTVERGYDGTSGKAHAIGTSVEHTVAAIDYREATGPRTLRVSHTWSISGDVLVPSGSDFVIPPMFVVVPAFQTVKVAGIRYVIGSGTQVTFSMRRAPYGSTTWTDLTALAGRNALTSDQGDDPTAITLADGDKIAPVVTAISGSPKNLSITALLDYTSVI